MRGIPWSIRDVIQGVKCHLQLHIHFFRVTMISLIRLLTPPPRESSSTRHQHTKQNRQAPIPPAPSIRAVVHTTKLLRSIIVHRDPRLTGGEPSPILSWWIHTHDDGRSTTTSKKRTRNAEHHEAVWLHATATWSSGSPLFFPWPRKRTTTTAAVFFPRGEARTPLSIGRPESAQARRPQHCRDHIPKVL